MDFKIDLTKLKNQLDPFANHPNRGLARMSYYETLAALKLLFPKKLEAFVKLDTDFWNEAMIDLFSSHNYHMASGYHFEKFNILAFHLAILASEKAEITRNGIKLYGKKAVKSSNLNMPIGRNF